MDRHPTPILFLLRLAGAGLLAALAGLACAQAKPEPGPDIPAAVRSLATEDPQVQRARWGDLAAAVGKPWLHVAPGEVANVWRYPRWVVPGAVMRYHRGFCIAAQCQGTDYLVQYNAQTRQLDFLDNASIAYVGRIQEDGSVRLVGTGLVGVLTAETLKFDASAGMLLSDKHELRPASVAQLAAATRGLAGQAAEPATATASQTTSADAELRAELAAMKAKVEALSRQVEQQAAPTAPRLTPKQAREAELRAQREAKARAAAEAKQAREDKAREDAARRAEAQARAREEAQAKVAQAQREAEEQRARQEAARRAAEEARVAQAQRLAEEKRLQEEAKRAAQDEQRARAEASRRAAQEQKTAQPPVASAAVPKPNACGGVDGVYGIVASNYRIEVKFGDEMLMVREPNRDSPYRHIGQCQYAFTHPNGTEYRLGVTPRALVAYKPGQSESQKTPLALIQAAAAPQASGKCKAEQIPVLNPEALHPGLTRLFGTRSLPGVELAGTYKAPEPDGHPMTVLAPGGGGKFEVYGAPKPQHVYRIDSWHIQVNCDGTPVAEHFPAGSRYYLVYKVQPAYQGQDWQRTQFIVRKDGRLSIDDRLKDR